MVERFFSDQPNETHLCTSYRDGEWIVWKCPYCEDYERRFNWHTGEMHINRGQSSFLHTGMCVKDQNLEGLTRIASYN